MQFNPKDQSTLLHLQCLPISNSFLCGLLPYQGTSERSQMVSTYHLIKTPALHHWTECNTVTLFFPLLTSPSCTLSYHAVFIPLSVKSSSWHTTWPQHLHLYALLPQSKAEPHGTGTYLISCASGHWSTCQWCFSRARAQSALHTEYTKSM